MYVHDVHGKLSWNPFRARCRMAQRANGTRSACRKLFSCPRQFGPGFHLFFPNVFSTRFFFDMFFHPFFRLFFTLVFTLVCLMPSSTSVASSARPQVQGGVKERKAPVPNAFCGTSILLPVKDVEIEMEVWYKMEVCFLSFACTILYLPMPPLLNLLSRVAKSSCLEPDRHKGFHNKNIQKPWTHALKSSIVFRCQIERRTEPRTHENFTCLLPGHFNHRAELRDLLGAVFHNGFDGRDLHKRCHMTQKAE